MCSPDLPNPARDRGPSKQAAPDTLQIGQDDDPERRKKKGRSQVRTRPVSSQSALNIGSGDDSGLRI